MSDKENCCDAPLIELLQKVPEDARAIYEHNSTSHSNVPYGNYCHRAAQRIKELEESIAQLEADYEKQFNEVEDKTVELEDAQKRIEKLEAALDELVEQDKWCKAEGIKNGEAYLTKRMQHEAEICKLGIIVSELKAALKFYREFAADCNKHGKEGAIARDRLAKDAGKKAEQALNKQEKGDNNVRGTQYHYYIEDELAKATQKQEKS